MTDKTRAARLPTILGGLVTSIRRSEVGRGVVVGALAGAVGTAAMDLLLYERYRRTGGTEGFWPWETAAGVTSWAGASAPGQVGQKLERFVARRPPPDRWARRSTNAIHWAMGVTWGVQYGVVAGATSWHPLVRAVALGPVVWLSGYAVLPLIGVYRPIWTYDSRTLADDLSAHLVYGAVTSSVVAAIGTSRSGDRSARW